MTTTASRLFMAIIFCCLLVVPLSALAGQLSWIINGKAIHLGEPAGTHFNEKNWGFGFQYDYDLVNGKWLPYVTASGFRDSLRNPSYYVGSGYLRRYHLNLTKARTLNVDVGAIAFLMTREDFKHNRPFPGILPVASIGTDKIAVNLTYIPKVHPKLVPLWFFQLKIATSLFQ